MHKQVDSIDKSSNKEEKFFKKIRKKKNFNLMVFITFMIGVLLIFCTYAWFFASLDVKVKNFNMIVTDNNGLSISFDGINFSQSVQISEDTLINQLKNTYPSNTSQWASWGLRPVSSVGIINNNDFKFPFFMNKKMNYKDIKREYAYLNTSLIEEKEAFKSNYYIAFDLFFKNVTGSPISDNLYLKDGTGVLTEDTPDENTNGLINSMRFGFVKIGSTSLETDSNTVQNLSCNNDCESFIYEPNSTVHSDLSISKARAYGLNLVKGQFFPTYAMIKPGDEIDLRSGIVGANLNTEYFALQRTKTNFYDPIFSIPDGITKARVYVWIEGQDIDSLETSSDGKDISININFEKDTAGYDYYN